MANRTKPPTPPTAEGAGDLVEPVAGDITWRKPGDPTLMPAPAMKLWHLSAKNIHAAPFYFANSARMYVVAAVSEEDARRLASLDAGQYGPVWRDDEMTDCVELAPTEPSVIAHMPV